MPRYTITNFSRGEFAPQLYGRVDIPQYAAGAKEITNFIVQRYGGAAFRPGFRFVGEVDDVNGKYRYLPFVQSIDQAYVMNLGDQSLRLLASGGYVTEDNLKIEGVVYGATTTLHVSLHGMAIGDRVYFDGTDVPALNGRFAKVTALPDADHFTVDINSTEAACFTALTTSTGTIRTAPPVAPPAPPAPPPDPPAPPPPPDTTGGGGSGGTGGDTGTGTYGNNRDRYGVGGQIP